MKNKVNQKDCYKGTGANIILIWLLIVLFSSGTSETLSQLIGGLKFFVSSQNVRIAAFLLACSLLLLGFAKINKIKDLFWLITPGIFVLLAAIAEIFNIEVNNSAGEMTKSFISIFVLYFLVIYAKQSISHFKTTRVANFIVIVGVIEACMGIYQHLSRNPIFDTQNLMAVFYLKGSSSSDPIFLSMGASVRAFGTMDSGLRLGIFLLMCIAIMLDFTVFARKIKIVLFILFCGAILFTQTRNVYIGLFLFLLVYFLISMNKQNVNFLKLLYIISAVLTSSLFWFSFLLNWLISLANNASILTFAARFRYINIAVLKIPDFAHFIFGSGIKAQEDMPIDSFAVSILTQYGLLFLIASWILLYSIFSKVLSRKRDNGEVEFRGVSAYLFVLPILAASNNLQGCMLISSAMICILVNSNNNLFDSN